MNDEDLTGEELTALREVRTILRKAKTDSEAVIAAVENVRPRLPESLWRALLLADEMTEASASMNEAAQRIDCAQDGLAWFMGERSVSADIDKMRRAAVCALRDRAVGGADRSA
jgi:hypothetical protein